MPTDLSQKEALHQNNPRLFHSLPNRENYPLHHVENAKGERAMRPVASSISYHGTRTRGFYIPHSQENGQTLVLRGGKVRFDISSTDLRDLHELVLEFELTNTGDGAVVCMPVMEMIERIEVRLGGKNTQYIYSIDEVAYINATWPDTLFKQRAESMLITKEWQANVRLASGQTRIVRHYLSTPFFAQAGFQGAGTDFTLQFDFEFRARGIARLLGGASIGDVSVANLRLHAEDFYMDEDRKRDLMERHAPTMPMYLNHYYSTDEHRRDVLATQPNTEYTINLTSLSGNVAALFVGLRRSEVERGRTEWYGPKNFILRGPSGDPIMSREFTTLDYNKTVQAASDFDGRWLLENDIPYIPFAADLAHSLTEGSNTGGHYFSEAGDLKLVFTTPAAAVSPVFTISLVANATAGSYRLFWTDPISKVRLGTGNLAHNTTAAAIGIALGSLPNFHDAIADITVTGTAAAGPIVITLTGFHYGIRNASKITASSLEIVPNPLFTTDPNLTLSTAGSSGWPTGGVAVVADVVAYRQRDILFKKGKLYATQE